MDRSQPFVGSARRHPATQSRMPSTPVSGPLSMYRHSYRRLADSWRKGNTTSHGKLGADRTGMNDRLNG
jgi:hypothetical protein